jgi:hypothetical protein
MKHKDAVALVEIITGNRFIQVMAILVVSLLALPWVAFIIRAI